MSEEDRELTELAAKAAGEEVEWLPYAKVFYRKAYEWPREKGFFAPLHDDGEALRLAVLLSLRIEPYTGVKMGAEGSSVANITDVYSLHSQKVVLSESHGLDPNAATRRAIVRAAAEIGKATA